jgi:phosphohistidine phosphatase
MILYIVRHAIAVERSAGVADEDRELTKEGIVKMRQAAAGLRALGGIPEIIFSSPLLRARQTAEILIEAFGGKIPLTLVPALASSANHAQIYKEIHQQESAGAIMLVGHQPLLGEMIGEIISGSSGCLVDLKKGGACAIQIETHTPAPRGTLLWFTPPAILRKLA